MIVRRSPAVAVPLVYYQELLVEGMPFEVPVADVEPLGNNVWVVSWYLIRPSQWGSVVGRVMKDSFQNLSQ